MITIIHGEDVGASRKYFLDLAKNKKIFDGETLVLSDLVQTFEGQGMFDDASEIFAQNFLSRKATGSAFEEIIAYLNKHPEFSITFWEPKATARTKLSLLKKSEIKEFKFPQYLFTFLDNIRPNNTQQVLTLFHQNLETSEPEMLLFMLERQFRLLLGISSSSGIDEVKRLAPWQRGKLEKQASLLGPGKLIQLYKKLFEIDLAQKTGGLSASLSQSIDFFLMEI